MTKRKNGLRHDVRNPLKNIQFLARLEGFEPPAYGLEGMNF